MKKLLLALFLLLGFFSQYCYAAVQPVIVVNAGGSPVPVTIGVSEAVNAQTGTSYTILNGDWGKLVTHSNASAIAVTLPQANSTTFVAGWFYDTVNLGAGTVTITPTTSTIQAAATLVLKTGQGARIVSDGTNYFVQPGAAGTYLNGLTAGTVTASKAIVVDANKHIDTIGLPTSGLKIGASGSEVAVTGTAAELNTNAGVTAGTVTASKTVVVDSNKDISTFRNVGIAALAASDNLTMGTAAKGLVLKQGANGKAGTFVCTSGGDIAISNTSIAITDAIIVSLNTVGGTVSTAPAVFTITASTGFHAKCATSDTSTYNYAIISNAP